MTNKKNIIKDFNFAAINFLKRESSGLAFYFSTAKINIFTIKDIKITVINKAQLHTDPIKGGSTGPHIDKLKSKILLTEQSI